MEDLTVVVHASVAVARNRRRTFQVANLWRILRCSGSGMAVKPARQPVLEHQQEPVGWRQHAAVDEEVAHVGDGPPG
jgi:hypothetical protein